ncbi:hypothetical protein NQ318_017504 [Aromia moschata]|uniref:Centromere protein J C-terminal domain-containing protein n=1 Tax=Aromia moschata TaxID=1265417 RepID=A0AAV8XPU1_9CUCU|nr:hypothetical protein NQ318_017504 [Aromia moschata]
MSLFPTSMMVRLQELKMWQGNYDSMLRNQSKDGSAANPSDYETIEGLSALDSTLSSPTLSPERRRTVDWDKKMISPPKPFEQLLEEKLAEDNPLPVIAKPKKPFLRKGSGLSSAPVKRKSCLKTTNATTEPDVDLTPLKMPEFEMKSKASWHRVLEQSKENYITHADHTDVKELDLKTPKNHFNSHIIGKINDFALKHFFPHGSKKNVNKHINSKKIVHENNTENELRIFEALEERVENSSFDSTNSSIIRLLSSTPNKIMKPLPNSPISEETKFVSENAYDPKMSDDRTVKLHQKLHEVNKKSDMLHDFLKNLKKNGRKRFEKKAQGVFRLSEKTPNRTPDTSFEDHDKWSSNTGSDTRSPSPPSCYTDSETTYKGDYSNRIDAAVNTTFKDEDETILNQKCANCEELERKLEELQKALPDVKAEKARVMDFAKELERKRDKTAMEMQKLRRDYENELSELRREIESEKKKYAKEKAVFDMKRKNGATQARLRNQVKQLEKDNSELKTEIEKLQRENSKLSASQKLQRRPSEVKMLHEINKNLSRLTEEAFKKQLTKSDNDLSEDDTKEETKKGKASREKENEGEKKYRQRFNVKKRQSCLKNKILDDVDVKNSINETCGSDITNFANLSLEKQYENAFGQFPSPRPTNNSLNDSKKEKTETIFEDGSKEIRYSNGNTKTISPDHNLIIVKYYNGDIKESDLIHNTLKYYYAENSTWHTQFSDGTELLEYANGQTEKKYKDGKSEITYPDGSFITRMPDGTEEVLYRDGSKLIKNLAGDRILLLPNGQKEIHTKEHKRREYPDGTVKILYPDGTQETRYASGRVRVKDSNGILIMDSQKSE